MTDIVTVEIVVDSPVTTVQLPVVSEISTVQITVPGLQGPQGPPGTSVADVDLGTFN